MPGLVLPLIAFVRNAYICLGCNQVMVSPLRYYKRDPMGKGRGAGEYYMRRYKGKKHYSKYSEERDAKISGRPAGRYGSSDYRHAADNVKYKTDGKVKRYRKKV